MTRASRLAAHETQIREWYGAMFQAWGRQHWWPAQSRFEVIAGAFLTQNTAWTNVERALTNLRRARALSLNGIRTTPIAKLEELVRPSGYFRQKAQRLKTFVRHLDQQYGGSLDRMFARPTAELREEFLGLNGVGPETADSILLYAGNHPVFVVDSYTRRLLHRHAILPVTADYEEVRELFERALGDSPPGLKPHRDPTPIGTTEVVPFLESGFSAASEVVPRQTRVGPGVSSVQAGQSTPTTGPHAHPPSRMSVARRGDLAQRYNEMHGLIVTVGKHHCHKGQPNCEGCPLQPFLPPRGPRRMPPPPRKAGPGPLSRSL